MRKPRQKFAPRREEHRSNAAKAKQGAGTYWLYGLHAGQAALANTERKVLRVLATEAVANELQEPARRVEIVDPATIERFAGHGTVHQGLAVLVQPLAPLSLEELLFTEREAPLLLLDQVTDPHNVGAILRSAAAFDCRAVIVPRHHAAAETGVLAKAASGALEIVTMIQVGNLVQAMEVIKKAGYWIAGLDDAASQTLAAAKLSPKTALVLGAEGAGLRRLTREHCDLLVKLPTSERMPSLNVSNAAAVALYALRQN